MMSKEEFNRLCPKERIDEIVEIVAPKHPRMELLYYPWCHDTLFALMSQGHSFSDIKTILMEFKPCF